METIKEILSILSNIAKDAVDTGKAALLKARESLVKFSEMAKRRLILSGIFMALAVLASLSPLFKMPLVFLFGGIAVGITTSIALRAWLVIAGIMAIELASKNGRLVALMRGLKTVVFGTLVFQIIAVLYLMVVPVANAPWTIMLLLAAVFLSILVVLWNPPASLSWVKGVPTMVFIGVAVIAFGSAGVRMYTESQTLRAEEAHEAQVAVVTRATNVAQDLTTGSWSFVDGTSGNTFPIRFSPASIAWQNNGALRAFTFRYSFTNQNTGNTHAIEWSCNLASNGLSFVCNTVESWPGGTARGGGEIVKTGEMFEGFYTHQGVEYPFVLAVAP